MSKRYDDWNEVKKDIQAHSKEVFFRERDIFWASIGINIGFEQDGKGKIFSRPVLVLKKFSKNLFFGIPLSTQVKEGSFFYEFMLKGCTSNALLVQGRLYDSKRLENKIGMINKQDFYKLKSKYKKLLDV